MRESRHRLLAATFAAAVMVLALSTVAHAYPRTVLGECFLAAG